LKHEKAAYEDIKNGKVLSYVVGVVAWEPQRPFFPAGGKSISIERKEIQANGQDLPGAQVITDDIVTTKP
jgi:hypothetical protein